MAEIDRHGLADGDVDGEARRAEGARGAGARTVQVGADRVGFETEHELPDLPVVSDLAAADESAVVSARSGKRAELSRENRDDRSLRRKNGEGRPHQAIVGV